MRSLVQAVVSCPPPCVAVLKKKPPVLPTSFPCCHSCPVLSQNALNCAGADPYLDETQHAVSQMCLSDSCAAHVE